jgi:hypothetical protein
MAHASDRTCVCGHPREAHEHYRAGTDCALCGRSGCSRFRVAGSLWSRLRGLLGGSFAVGVASPAASAS